MPLVRVASLTRLKPDTVIEFKHGDLTIAVANVGGRVQAFQGVCPHQGGPLGQGNVADGNLICPWHGWEYSCATGECDINPKIKLERYAVEVKGDEVFVKLP
jgi:nitrite reductase (NADH) small subunit